jgi:hypothetical protein
MSNDGRRVTNIDLGADWTGGPFWVGFNGKRGYETYYTDEITKHLSLSDDLLQAITAWDRQYQRLLNQDDPASSDFPSPQAEVEFNAAGLALARRLRAELPAEILVEYGAMNGDGITLQPWRLDIANLNVTEVLVRVEFGAGPLWVSFDDGDVPGPYDADDISEVVSLSDSLLEAIAAWDNQWRSTYVDDDPASSGIKEPQERAAFIAVTYAPLDGSGSVVLASPQ